MAAGAIFRAVRIGKQEMSAVINCVLLTCHGRNSWQVFYGYVTARFDAPGT